MAQDDDQKIKITFDTNAGKASVETTKLGGALDGVDNSTEKVVQSQKAMKAQLREANAELHRSIQLYGETSVQATNAAKGVADLKDQIKFAQDLSKSFDPDQKFKALGAATQIAATGMQGATAGMALFGDQSKDTQKALLKVQAAMAFSDAVSNLSNLGDQWKVLKSVVLQSTAANKINSASMVLAAMVTKLFGASVDTTSKSFKFLKVAIAATGIGAIVVGIGLLITNFDKVKTVIANLIPGAKEVFEWFGKMADKVKEVFGLDKKSKEEIAKENSDFHERNRAAARDAFKKEEADQKAANEKAAASRKAERERKEAADKKAAEREIEKAEERKTFRATAASELLAEIEKENAELLAKKEAYNKAFNDSLKEQGKGIVANQINIVEKTKIITDQELADLELAEQAKLEIRQTAVSNVESIGQSLQQLAGKNKALAIAGLVIEKIVGVATIIKNTLMANAKAVASFPVTGGMPFVAINTAAGALGVASTIKATATAISALGGGGAGGGSSSIPAVAGGAAPSVQFNNTAENQIGQSVSRTQQAQPPIRVYVAESDISTAQNNVQVLVRTNTFP